MNMIEIIKNIIPIIVGALIAIAPTLVEKYTDRKNNKEISEQKNKQEMYVKLISLLGVVLSQSKVQIKTCSFKNEVDSLRDLINMISITGSTEVVSSLNNYIDTWAKGDSDIQTKKYTELLKTIRVDLEVDKKKNKDFPEIGLRDINFK